MKKKIIGLFVCMMLIATVIPVVTSVKNSVFNSTVPNTQQTSMAVNWTEMQKLLASDGTTNDFFGISVSIDGDTALIGAHNDSGKGAAYVFTRTGTIWTQQARLLASDGAANDQFGYSVSLSGDTALIGAPTDDPVGSYSGSAYVFTRTGITWTQQAKLYDWNGAAYDFFGFSVSLFDANNAIIGEPFHEVNGHIAAGAAYVFFRTGTTWNYDSLFASDGAANDFFGYSVSLSGDTALIGAPNADNFKGWAYVFTRVGVFWEQQQKLTASIGAPNDQFGWSVSLSGETALIGAAGDDDNGDTSGAAYVFTRTGTTWVQQQKLTASDAAPENLFGDSVSISGDTALIGAIEYDGFKGSAYVFSRTGATWAQQAKLLVSDGAVGDQFGGSVSISGDTALIGAPWDDDVGAKSGSAYVFTKSENQPPETPIITGPSKGKINVATDYNFTTSDPDDDDVYYFIDWGDGTNSSWIGSYPSGDVVTQSHTWTKKGTYTIKAKAKDSNGAESDWKTLSVTMPYSYNLTFMQFMVKLLERFPNVFPILRQLLTY